MYTKISADISNLSNFNIKSEKTAKIVAIILGIFCGCFYGSYFRKSNNEKPVNSQTEILFEKLSRIELTEPKNQTINETALFLVDDDTSLADELARHIKVLCWMQVKYYDEKRFDAIKKTWGRRCTAFIAIVSEPGTNSTDIFHIPDDANQLSNWENVYRFIANTYANEFDWFLNTDGNSFIVVENLRFNLYAYDPMKPIVVGLLKNSTNQPQQYLSMKAGFALSRRAVGNLVAGFSNASENCAAVKSSEDEIHFSLCLHEVDIFFGKSTDQHGKQLFFDEYLDRFFLPISIVKLPYPWYQDYKVNHYLNSASNYSIAFYGLTWEQMYVMEFLIYQLRPYGVETIIPPLPERI